ncbi:hypothetical protein F5X97DRAFT_306871 [Nemania serpens]|nr:hypothetical protein F5X97DRAFT_306871 [Nemania serpens]
MAAPRPSSLWQDRWPGACRDYQIQPPDYQLVSDRRGKSHPCSSITAHEEVLLLYVNTCLPFFRWPYGLVQRRRSVR